MAYTHSQAGQYPAGSVASYWKQRETFFTNPRGYDMSVPKRGALDAYASVARTLSNLGQERLDGVSI